MTSLSVLCLDCQRHELYKTQYRAMFVHRNSCRVDAHVDTQQSSMGEGGAVHGVSCQKCNTRLGVIDTETVYHFYNVIPSEA